MLMLGTLIATDPAEFFVQCEKQHYCDTDEFQQTKLC